MACDIIHMMRIMCRLLYYRMTCGDINYVKNLFIGTRICICKHERTAQTNNIFNNLGHVALKNAAIIPKVINKEVLKN